MRCAHHARRCDLGKLRDVGPSPAPVHVGAEPPPVTRSDSEFDTNIGAATSSANQSAKSVLDTLTAPRGYFHGTLKTQTDWKRSKNSLNGN